MVRVTDLRRPSQAETTSLTSCKSNAFVGKLLYLYIGYVQFHTRNSARYAYSSNADIHCIRTILVVVYAVLVCNDAVRPPYRNNIGDNLNVVGRPHYLMDENMSTQYINNIYVTMVFRHRLYLHRSRINLLWFLLLWLGHTHYPDQLHIHKCL
ncbi:hypothetical protein NVI2019_OHEONHNH_04054 (plasmid) [Providencia alcalifaciens]|nr:hypothetical protein NVI2019_KOLGMIGM_04056 [Providencia alcalifaciens]CAG9436665.1 hypothetical protein NVI2019_PLFLNFOB_04054 [Providencia alcalifaciens]CAG9436688.1 hypothetical protein NVI2019_ANGEOOBF_04055 [Providencia alcalifaciens]CAG9436912.1 hypothetical protein NVI2019_OGMBKCAO_04115 [Providencia alcalifaciens]CAG9437564.1 hypothetical protein NVI2019_OHEONHNH_04054 [Providencia alcalifaciens]